MHSIGNGLLMTNDKLKAIDWNDLPDPASISSTDSYITASVCSTAQRGA